MFNYKLWDRLQNSCTCHNIDEIPIRIISFFYRVLLGKQKKKFPQVLLFLLNLQISLPAQSREVRPCTIYTADTRGIPHVAIEFPPTSGNGANETRGCCLFLCTPDV